VAEFRLTPAAEHDLGTIERTVSVRTRGGQVKERLFTSLDAVARFMRDKFRFQGQSNETA